MTPTNEQAKQRSPEQQTAIKHFTLNQQKHITKNTAYCQAVKQKENKIMSKKVPSKILTINAIIGAIVGAPMLPYTADDLYDYILIGIEEENENSTIKQKPESIINNKNCVFKLPIQKGLSTKGKLIFRRLEPIQVGSITPEAVSDDFFSVLLLNAIIQKVSMENIKISVDKNHIGIIEIGVTVTIETVDSKYNISMITPDELNPKWGKIISKLNSANTFDPNFFAVADTIEILRAILKSNPTLKRSSEAQKQDQQLSQKQKNKKDKKDCVDFPTRKAVKSKEKSSSHSSMVRAFGS